MGTYIAECLDDPDRRNRVLPIGGPGEAVTPKGAGEQLFRLARARSAIQRMCPWPFWTSSYITLAMLGRLVPTLAAKAELARIGRYYATESMLVLDPVTGQYDARATPSTGSETLFDYYARVIRGEPLPSRGDHAVF